jgi:hypothetical protein
MNLMAVALGFRAKCGNADLECYLRDHDALVDRLAREYEIDFSTAENLAKCVEKPVINWGNEIG